MTRKIAVLFDSFFMRSEAIDYSIELAKRMDCSLILLVLLPYDSDEVALNGEEGSDGFEKRSREALMEPVETARQRKIVMEAEVRIGDPSSELLKFMAGSRSIRSVVWGGSTDSSSTKCKMPHWLDRMKDKLECPIVLPAQQHEGAKTAKRS